ncbi:MAG: hypothetical protein DSY58_07730 [Desulfobulbus sp.]|nr:MAG: hypothetical protein DSY58_07730 [Desulfobulbus sp.]
MRQRVEWFVFSAVFVAFFVLIFFAVMGQVALAACPSFSRLIQNGSYGISDINGKIISACNADKAFVPASILKIPTALTAFSILGPDFRFKTNFYLDEQNDLYIQGFGDPLLISEEIKDILAELKHRGVGEINSIFVDNSSFALEHQVPGSEFSDNPYDAPVGPIAVNFNSIPVRVTKKRRVVSGEQQTPYIELMAEVADNFLPGSYRINICRDFCNADQQMARYTTQLFRAMQHKAGIPGQGDTGIKKIPADAVKPISSYICSRINLAIFEADATFFLFSVTSKYASSNESGSIKSVYCLKILRICLEICLYLSNFSIYRTPHWYWFHLLLLLMFQY